MIISANFKTNHSRVSTAFYIRQLNEFLKNENIKDEIIVFPTSIALDSFDGDVLIGAQNAYPTVSGSFTGEIGIEQLSEFGIKTILIGHSERRHILGESQELIAKKYAYFVRNKYKIIYCVGEPLEVREQGGDAVNEYILNQFDGIDTNYTNLIVAYEPVWAIGTGKVATVDEIKTTHSNIKKSIQKPLLYGGSVKVENIADILAINNVDGALIGTASWDIESFKNIIRVAKEID